MVKANFTCVDDAATPYRIGKKKLGIGNRQGNVPVAGNREEKKKHSKKILPIFAKKIKLSIHALKSVL